MSKNDNDSQGKDPKGLKGVSTFNGYNENMLDEPDLPEVSKDN